MLGDGDRITLAGELTIGRSPANDVRLVDPSISRRHARISVAADGSALLQDVGSSYGTWVDGRRVESPVTVRPGARIRLGDQEIAVSRAPSEDEAGHTLAVRLHNGYALKRLEAAEGEQRWVLKDIGSGRFLRLSSDDAALVPLLDGSRSVSELMRAAEERQGPHGPERLAVLLAALDARQLQSHTPPRRRGLSRSIRWAGAATLFSRLYDAGGRRLLTRPALAGLAALAVTGLAVFVALIALRYGTPFVVANKVGLGGAVFVLGRLGVAAVHESAHGLVMASFGRPVREAGLKLFLVFPYVYVDTSEAWFEPRRRRIAVSAAGPASDLVPGRSLRARLRGRVARRGA